MSHNFTMSGMGNCGMRHVNDGERTVTVSDDAARAVAGPILIIGSALGGAVKGLFWGWVITRFAAPTGHPIRRGALIGAGLGAALATVAVVVSR